MIQSLQDIREQQKATWNKFSPGWKKWDELTMDFLKPMGEEIIHQLDLKETDTVLDVASGTGEPGLTIATTLKRGKVILTDLADDMLVIAHENALKRGIKNVEFSVADASELPFADNTFDAISCRFGFMFFPDLLSATKEIVRVLKPGGKLAASVWNGPEKNFWITAIMDTLKRYVDLPTAPPDTPGYFRCAKAVMMSELFSKAGLKNIHQEELIGKLSCKTADVYWDFMTETPALVAKALSTVEPSIKEKIKAEVYDILKQKYPDGNVIIDAGSWIVSGEK